MAQLAIMAGVMALQIGLQLAFQKKPKTPSQPELQPTSSIFGTPIKLTYGSMIQGGTVIWQSRRRKKKKDVGKGGGGATIVSYHQDFLISFGEAGRDIIAIFGDGKQQPIYDGRAKKVKQKYRTSPIRFYKGGDTQLPDPLIEKDRGVGNCSANRRINSVMFEDFPLDDWGGRIPNLRALVVHQPSLTNSVDPFITNFNSPAALKVQRGALAPDRRAGKPFVYGSSNDGWLYRISTATCTIDDQARTAYTWGPVFGGAFGSLDTDSDGFFYYAGNSAGTLTFARTTVAKFDCDSLLPILSSNHNGPSFFVGSGMCRVNQYDRTALYHIDLGTARDTNSTFTFFDRSTMSMLYQIGSAELASTLGAPWGSRHVADVDGDDQGNAWAIYGNPSSSWLIRYTADRAVHFVVDLTATIPGANKIAWVQEENTLLIGSTTKIIVLDITTLAVTATTPFASVTNLNSFHAGFFDHGVWMASDTLVPTVPVAPGATQYFPTFTQFDVRTLAVLTSHVFTEAAPQYPLSNHHSFSPMVAIFMPANYAIISDDYFGQNVGCFHLIKGTSCNPLRQVVEDLSLRTGRLDVATQVDASTLVQSSDQVCGYVREQRQPPRQDLELLGQAYAFYAVESDWKIKFHHFGGTPVLTIPEEDLGAFEGGQTRPDLSLEEELIPDYERPKRVDITYFDEDMNYQQNTQHWDITARNLQSSDEQVITMPLVFRRDIAKDVARRLLYQMRNEAIPYSFTLPPKYLFYDAGDDTTLTMRSGAQLPVKLTKVELGANFLLRCEAVVVNPPLYVPVLGKGGPGGGPIPIEIGQSPPTTLILLDAPALRDAEAKLITMGPYVAVAPSTGSTRDWAGTVALKSRDGGSTWEEVDILTAPTIMGFALTTLGTPRAWTVWDEVNTVRVQLTYEGEGLESLTRDHVLAGGNPVMVGNEVIHFRTATPIGDAGDQVWELSGLLRGRKGTEWAISSHGVGERCTLLNAASMDRLTDSLSELNLSRVYRAITAGQTIEASTPQTFINTGRALKPYAPAFVHFTRDAENNVTVTALQRSRFTNSWNPWNSPPSGEAISVFEMDVLVSGVIKRTMTADTLRFLYMATEQTIDGQTLGAPMHVRLYQRSQAVGRGFVNEATG